MKLFFCFFFLLLFAFTQKRRQLRCFCHCECGKDPDDVHGHQSGTSASCCLGTRSLKDLERDRRGSFDSFAASHIQSVKKKKSEPDGLQTLYIVSTLTSHTINSREVKLRHEDGKFMQIVFSSSSKTNPMFPFLLRLQGVGGSMTSSFPKKIGGVRAPAPAPAGKLTAPVNPDCPHQHLVGRKRDDAFGGRWALGVSGAEEVFDVSTQFTSSLLSDVVIWWSCFKGRNEVSRVDLLQCFSTGGPRPQKVGVE